jgi:hypothetical protein
MSKIIYFPVTAPPQQFTKQELVQNFMRDIAKLLCGVCIDRDLDLKNVRRFTNTMYMAMLCDAAEYTKDTLDTLIADPVFRKDVERRYLHALGLGGDY